MEVRNVGVSQYRPPSDYSFIVVAGTITVVALLAVILQQYFG
ncbi:MAG: hypothetical protein AAB372_03170 [Patescibacteria group bacterium]